MAFRKKKSRRTSYESPEQLFRDLRSRSVEGLLAHQADILRRYTESSLGSKNVAIELPTGSGKTLVGLLIAEFWRVTKRAQVVFLCPTKQLVRQVVNQSENSYGIKATAFTGKIKEYLPADRARYQAAETVAVAPYSALFNTNPFFGAPQLIILDDAHAADNYIASNWSLNITRWEYRAIYDAVLDLVADALSPHQLEKFKSDDPDLSQWIEHIPVVQWRRLTPALTALLDESTRKVKLQFPWSLVRDFIDSCLCYVSHRGILIRPYIPPTSTHSAFQAADQRVFMSATLGAGGDLERITGVRELERLPIPKGWDRQGIGRRFFMFPGMNLEGDELAEFVTDAARQANRALSLVPSDAAAAQHRKQFVAAGLEVLEAEDIEESKDTFITTDECVAILANRYEGLDLVGDECRLLILEGLPRAGNLQELFLLSRMACGTLLHDRIRTRIVQALGRCTRSATDYAAVVVLGDDFHNWLVANEQRKLFHPELQGELAFGVEQSTEQSAAELLENLQVFLDHGDEWDEVDENILDYRDEAELGQIPGEAQLMEAACLEVDHQTAYWNGDHERALELAQDIAGIYAGDALKGLRGFWNYLGASSAHWLFDQDESEVHRKKAQELYERAGKCVPALGWLRSEARLLAKGKVEDEAPQDGESLLAVAVERIETIFEARSYSSTRKFEKDVTEILAGLGSAKAKPFEAAQVRLGELLGFECGNVESNAAPDPWWVLGDRCLVFEDKNEEDPGHDIPVRHVKQAGGHEAWVRKHLKLGGTTIVNCIFLSPSETIDEEATTFAGDMSYWNLAEFQKWAADVVKALRKLRSTYSGPGNPAWRKSAAELLEHRNLDPLSVIDFATKSRLAEL